MCSQQSTYGLYGLVNWVKNIYILYTFLGTQGQMVTAELEHSVHSVQLVHSKQ